MKRMLLSMTLLAALAVASCQKNAAQDSELTTTKPKAGASVEVRAFENPFDYLGKEHNDAVQYGWDTMLETGDTTKVGKRARLVQYFKERYGRDLNKTIDGNAWMRNMSPEELLKHSPYGSTCTGLLRELLDAGKNLKELGNADEYLQAIKRIELEAVEAGLADNERDGVLQVAAIAKYSSDFWHKKLTDFPTPGNISSKWFIRLTSDILGGVIGLFGGDVLGDAAYMSDLIGIYTNG